MRTASVTFVFTFVVSGVVGSVLLSPASAVGKSRRDMASSCWQTVNSLNTDEHTVATDSDHSGFTGLNNQKSVDVPFSCPYRDDDRFLKQEVVTLNVHGYDAHNTYNATARACSQYYSYGGGICGTGATSSGTGDFTLSPNLTAWGSTYANEFGYVLVILPRVNGNYWSALRGWWTST